MKTAVQIQLDEIDRRRWLDEDTYYPLRDDTRLEREGKPPRQRAAMWLISAKSVSRELTAGQIEVATRIRNVWRELCPKREESYVYVQRGFDPARRDHRFLKKRDLSWELSGFEIVANQVPEGRDVFWGVCEEDSLAQMERRLHRVNDRRGVIEAVRCTLHALELYAGFNAADAEAWNARA